MLTFHFNFKSNCKHRLDFMSLTFMFNCDKSVKYTIDTHTYHTYTQTQIYNYIWSKISLSNISQKEHKIFYMYVSILLFVHVYT